MAEQNSMYHEMYRNARYAQSTRHYPTLCLERYESIGGTLADTLDDLISSRRIEPQLAIKIMTNFDKAIAQVLGEKVKARMSFKVRERLSIFTSALFSVSFTLCPLDSGDLAHPLSHRASPSIA